jgi:hypothetical protein
MMLCVSCPEGHSVSVAPGKLGGAIACPCCFAVFHPDLELSAVREARKEEKKARRSRDDDDDEDDDGDEEEEEKPRKKKSAAKPKGKADERVAQGKPPAKPKAKAEEPKKDAKPAAKKAASKKDEEDEDEEEEEDEDEEEAEPEINWTPRKRQLSLCTVGLNITIGAFATLILFTAAVMVGLDYFMFFDVMQQFQATTAAEKVQKAVVEDYGILAAFYAGPFFALAQIILLVGLFFSLSVPAKAEARSLALSGIVFGGLTFVFGILVLLAEYKIVVSDDIRAANMKSLMGGAAGLCFVVSLMSTMAFQAKLMMFMNMKLEASQAVTNVGFYFLFLAGMFVGLFASIYICNYLHYFLGYAVILAICAAAGMAGRSLYAQIALMLKLQKTIRVYIKEAV